MAAMGSRRASRSASWLRLAALLVVLTVGGWGTWAALAASGPAAPTISSAPANPANQNSASFTYTDSQAVAKFQCALDGSAFSDCGTTRPSTKTYSGLAQGSHTFQVRAVDSKGNLSSATSYTWTIDTTPPTVSSINRANASPTNAASVSWTVTFSESVTGVATTNFSLTASGFSSTPTITGLSGSGATYTITASTDGSTPTGSASLQLNLTSAGTVKDLAGNGLSGVPFSGQTYAVDKTAPPAPTITSGPPNPSNQTTATFSFSDSESGVSFLCKLDSGSYSACSNPASFSSLAQGSHMLSVQAKDAAGNVSSGAASYSWVVDTTPPPTPTITSGPPNNSTSTSATFTFTDSEAGVTFSCQIDNGPFTPCTSPTTYTGLGIGGHQFGLRARDAAGNQSAEALWNWQIKTADFTITGNAVGLLYPGADARTIQLTLGNANDVPLYVTALTVAVDTSKLPSDCGGSNFQFAQSSISSTNTVTIPQHGTVTLSSPPIAPTIQMPDLTSSQDGCKGVSVSLSYSGSAHS
jgi:hypothetical protein